MIDLLRAFEFVAYQDRPWTQGEVLLVFIILGIAASWIAGIVLLIRFAARSYRKAWRQTHRK